MECTLCGKDVEQLNKVFVEGSIVEVCERCVKFGKKIYAPVAYKPIIRKIEFKELDTELVPDYGKVIAKTRGIRGLTREEFAKRISEKESAIKRLEEQQMEPDKEVIRKIENFLGIKLTEEYREEKNNIR